MEETDRNSAANKEILGYNGGVSHGAETQFDEYFRLAEMQLIFPIAWPRFHLLLKVSI
jgi:hypothetical protein